MSEIIKWLKINYNNILLIAGYIISIVLVAILIFGSCKTGNYKQELQASKILIETLKAENDNLKSENNRLLSKIPMLESEINESKKIIEAKKDELEKLAFQIASIELAINKLNTFKTNSK